jgi:hypothetical protein
MTRLKNKQVQRVVALSPSAIRADQLVVSIKPGGVLGLREFGRAVRTEQTIHIGELYGTLIQYAVNRSLRKTKEYVKTMHRGAARLRARREEGL